MSTTQPLPASQPPTLALPLFALSLLAIMSLLYLVARPLYRHLLTAVMRHPFRTPFFDLEYLLTTNTCWRRGIDVYVSNPCDQLNRPMGYSPLWLRLGFLAIDRSWSAPLGLGLTVLFCLSLALLPPTRSWRDHAVIGLAAISSLSLFAVERGNVDVMIYLVSVCAAWLFVRSTLARIAGYGLLLGAGLLKLYPFIALVSISRERLRLCVALAAAALATIALFFWSFRDELHRMARNIPHDSVYSNLIGAIQLPAGLAKALRPLISPIIGTGLADSVVSSPVLAVAGVIAPLLAAASIVFALMSSRDIRQAMPTIPGRPRALFLIGSALVTGCFFTGQSVGYRGILLLLVIPGFLALDRPGMPPRLQRIARATLCAILAAMFRLIPLGIFEREKLYPGNSALASLTWLGFEMLWWWIAAVLLGLLGCLLIDSPAAQEAWRYLKRQRAPGSATI